MALTGLPDLPLGPPAPLVEGVEILARPLPGLDALALLAERAASMGLWRRRRHQLRRELPHPPHGRGGFLAVNLPRAEDRDPVPAWLDSTPSRLPARRMGRRGPWRWLGATGFADRAPPPRTSGGAIGEAAGSRP